MISRKVKSLLEVNQCRSANSLSGRTDLYRSQPAYRISNRENDIKYEVMTFGPVQGKVPFTRGINKFGVDKRPIHTHTQKTHCFQTLSMTVSVLPIKNDFYEIRNLTSSSRLPRLYKEEFYYFSLLVLDM